MGGGATMTSWFDIVDIPVDLPEPENPKDIDVSVASVHKMLADIEDKGTPASSIVLGGFSQGGTVSLLAGLSYPKTLAGVILISGWCAKRENVASWISEAGKKTPVLMCCGNGDPVVDFNITDKSAQLLKAEMGDAIEIMSPKRGMHQPDPNELKAAKSFISQKL